jgi:hypothetical protein
MGAKTFIRLFDEYLRIIALFLLLNQAKFIFLNHAAFAPSKLRFINQLYQL